MCQFASAYPLEVLNKIVEVDSLLQNPTLEHVLNQTEELNQLVRQPVALNDLLSYAYHRYEQLLTDQD